MSSFHVPILVAFLFSPLLVSAQTPTIDFVANSTLHWTNSNTSSIQAYHFTSNHLVRVVLLAKASHKLYGASLAFAFGFYCDRRLNDGCLLAVMILDMRGGVVRADRHPQVVWMANRDRPVKDNATLSVVPGEGLALADSDGVKVWSTKVSLYSVGGMTLRDDGNLVLFNSSRSKAWKSFDHPADTLLMGQELRGKRKLKSSMAHTNPRTGKFYLSVGRSSLTAFVKYKKPVAYTRLPLVPGNYGRLRFVRFNSRSISFFYKKGGEDIPVGETLGQLSATQLLRLDPDGGPRVYIWQPEAGWEGLQYSLGRYDLCQKPLKCGKYGVCSNGECSCPIASDGTVYFNFPQSHGSGCRFPDASKSNSTKHTHRLVDFGNLSYFSYFDPTAATAGLTELEPCKRACESNSACMAAFFKYGRNASDGLCYLPTEILSIRGQPIAGEQYGSISFLKVPIPTHGEKGSSGHFSRSAVVKASISIVSAGICVAILGFILWRIRWRKCRGVDCFDQVIGAPTRFSYKELCLATGKFTTQLGRGGFGTVYRGELKDGTVIAVKRLDGVGHHTNEFVAEMKTMGSIHHVHLVKLIGFCAEESNRLLVYQYMSNGSLDKWIFDEERKEALGWEMRRGIILGIAKGLAYLHEDCSKRIAHLDVKPHNILLDERFSAKISDFGLARFIDRNQSQVVTGMRGTFGYLAPEWQHAKITVKADTYSFGIVVLETVSGRMVLDYTLPKSDVHLLAVLERMAGDGRMLDIVDKKIADQERNRGDILKMINVAVWCLNGDQAKRPSMSAVVKILEGTMEFEHSIEFKFDNVLVFSGASTDSCSSLLMEKSV